MIYYNMIIYYTIMNLMICTNNKHGGPGEDRRGGADAVVPGIRDRAPLPPEAAGRAGHAGVHHGVRRAGGPPHGQGHG